MLAPERRPEIRVGDAPPIPLTPLGARTVATPHLSLGLLPFLAVLFAHLLPRVLPRLILLLLILAARRLLHLTFVLLAFRMPVPALRPLHLLPLVLPSHLALISAPGFLIPPIVISPILRSRFIVAILGWRGSRRLLVLVFVLGDGQPCRGQQQRSENPTRD